MFPLAPDQPPTPSIAFSAQKNPWVIGAAYSEELVNSIYSNAAWEVQSTPSWISADSLTGTAGTAPLVITVAANTGEARSGNIVLKSLAGSTTYNITVIQDGFSPISVTPETLNFPAAGGTKSIILTAIENWDLSYSQPWSNVSKVSGTAGTYVIDITVEANGGSPRTDTVDFEVRNTGDVVSVTLNQ